MAGSQSFASPGAVAGLSLRAWALFASTGTLLKGSNVSSIVRNSVGNYTLTFATPLPDANVFLDVKLMTPNSGVSSMGSYSNAGTNYANVICMLSGGAATDPGMAYVGVYG